MKSKKQRCPWVISGNELYENYHDNEWGKPTYDDNKLFELLILEGAQSGLSWITILNKREGYRKAFKGFDPAKVSKFSEQDIENLIKNPEIVRHEGKIRSAIQNAKAFLSVQKEHASFSHFLWSYVNHKPVIHHFQTMQDLPSQSELSIKISKDLKKMGFSFVGPKTIYSLLQAAGLVNDHLVSCFCYKGSSWYVYMIRCDKGSLYTGITNDMDRRLEEHKNSSKGAKFFRSCNALNIEYFETYTSRSEALKRECDIKKMSKQDKEKLIQSK